jgi:hypothetical protein
MPHSLLSDRHAIVVEDTFTTDSAGIRSVTAGAFMTERELLAGTGGTVNICAQGFVGHAGEFLQLADTEWMVAHAALGGSDGVQTFDACHGISFDGRTQAGGPEKEYDIFVVLSIHHTTNLSCR